MCRRLYHAHGKWCYLVYLEPGWYIWFFNDSVSACKYSIYRDRQQRSRLYFNGGSSCVRDSHSHGYCCTSNAVHLCRRFRHNCCLGRNLIHLAAWQSHGVRHCSEPRGYYSLYRNRNGGRGLLCQRFGCSDRSSKTSSDGHGFVIGSLSGPVRHPYCHGSPQLYVV